MDSLDSSGSSSGTSLRSCRDQIHRTSGSYFFADDAEQNMEIAHPLVCVHRLRRLQVRGVGSIHQGGSCGGLWLRGAGSHLDIKEAHSIATIPS
jgi:hypothetical protein